MDKNVYNSPQKQNNFLLKSLSYALSPPARKYPPPIFSPKRTNIENSPILRQQIMVSPRKLQHINCILPKKQNIGGLYIGDSISTLKSSILINNEIETILCCNLQASNNVDSLKAQIQNIEFKFINIQDHQLYPINKHFTQAYEYIEKARNANKNVLVQCHAGVSRSGSILISYLMWKNKWSLEQTYRFVTDKRPRIKPNAGFWKQLEEYQQYLASLSSHINKNITFSINCKQNSLKQNSQKNEMQDDENNPQKKQKSFAFFKKNLDNLILTPNKPSNNGQKNLPDVKSNGQVMNNIINRSPPFKGYNINRSPAGIPNKVNINYNTNMNLSPKMKSYSKVNILTCPNEY